MGPEDSHHFVILGRPVVQKNRMQIRRNRKTGQSFIGKSPEVEAWMRRAVLQLRQQWHEDGPIEHGVFLNAAIVTYQGPRGKADASNLYEAPQDALQKAGIVSNDYWIRSHNGSDRLSDPAKPRVEITLTMHHEEKSKRQKISEAAEKEDLMCQVAQILAERMRRLYRDSVVNGVSLEEWPEIKDAVLKGPLREGLYSERTRSIFTEASGRLATLEVNPRAAPSGSEDSNEIMRGFWEFSQEMAHTLWGTLQPWTPAERRGFVRNLVFAHLAVGSVSNRLQLWPEK